jgi:hypothetical protein
VGTAGDLLYKPRGQWHTFWNAADGDSSLLDPIAAHHGLELDPSSIPALCSRFGVTF